MKNDSTIKMMMWIAGILAIIALVLVMFVPHNTYAAELETQTLYTTTGLNMRVAPDLESDIVMVLPRNTEVVSVGEFDDFWTTIIVKDSFGADEYYYLATKYLSTEKQVNTYLGTFMLTAYCNCSKCCGKWAGGGTASGTTPTAGRTVAMGGVSFGTKLLINGHVYTVEDRGTPYGHVDIYHNSHSEALNFGLRYAEVYRVD